jgi:hypothetical protein
MLVMAKGFLGHADDENMSLKQKLQRILAVTLALTGAAMAGNTTTTSTMRITVNVVPVQMASSGQETSGFIAFGNDAQFQMGTQRNEQPVEESLVISGQSIDQRASKSAVLDADSRSVLIRKTYIAK